MSDSWRRIHIGHAVCAVRLLTLRRRLHASQIRRAQGRSLQRLALLERLEHFQRRRKFVGKLRSRSRSVPGVVRRGLSVGRVRPRVDVRFFLR